MVELGEPCVAGSPAEWPPGLDVVDVLHFLGLREELGVSEDVVPHDRLLVLVLSHTTVPRYCIVCQATCLSKNDLKYQPPMVKGTVRASARGKLDRSGTRLPAFLPRLTHRGIKPANSGVII